MAETNTTATPGFSWGDLGKSILTKGVDLADSYAAMRVAQEQTEAQMKAAAAAAKAAATAPQNVATKAAATTPAPSLPSWVIPTAIVGGVLAVVGLIVGLFRGRRD